MEKPYLYYMKSPRVFTSQENMRKIYMNGQKYTMDTPFWKNDTITVYGRVTVSKK